VCRRHADFLKGRSLDNAHIPIIDLGGLVGGAPGGLEQAAQEIGEAAREAGFFYLKNHGIDADLIAAINVAAHAVFALPDADKLALTKDFHKTNRGYVPMEGKTLIHPNRRT
jgi:isopenicillin N synthase-like dioxygenase